MVKNAGLLSYLLREINKDPNIAGVGSWRLEFKPWGRRLAKHIEYQFQNVLYALLRKKTHRIEGKGDNPYYLRTHCALYRTDLITKYDLSFVDGGTSSGKFLHCALVDKGHKMTFLQPESLCRYVDHFNHATMIFHPELGWRGKGVDKEMKAITGALKALGADAILKDDSLDR